LALISLAGMARADAPKSAQPQRQQPVIRQQQQQQQQQPQGPVKPSRWFSCRRSHEQPAFVGWCHRGTVIAPLHLTPYQTIENFYGLAQLAAVIEVEEQTIALLTSAWSGRHRQLYTLVQVGIRDASAEVTALVQFNLVNWATQPSTSQGAGRRPSIRCGGGYQGYRCPPPAPPRDRQGAFWGGAQLGLLNRSAFHGGLQLGLANHDEAFYGGLQLGVYNGVADEFWGLGQVGGLNVADDFIGLFQLGAINAADDFVGSQLGLVNYIDDDSLGLQLGLLNVTDDNIVGLQLGVVNWCEREVIGAQIGLVNVSRELSGVQLGLVNIVTENAIPIMPLINLSWS
jgi:hypothetical protein